jgi:hypothetical protein
VPIQNEKRREKTKKDLTIKMDAIKIWTVMHKVIRPYSFLFCIPYIALSIIGKYNVR